MKEYTIDLNQYINLNENLQNIIDKINHNDSVSNSSNLNMSIFFVSNVFIFITLLLLCSHGIVDLYYFFSFIFNGFDINILYNVGLYKILYSIGSLILLFIILILSLCINNSSQIDSLNNKAHLIKYNSLIYNNTQKIVLYLNTIFHKNTVNKNKVLILKYKSLIKQSSILGEQEEQKKIKAIFDMLKLDMETSSSLDIKMYEEYSDYIKQKDYTKALKIFDSYLKIKKVDGYIMISYH